MVWTINMMAFNVYFPNLKSNCFLERVTAFVNQLRCIPSLGKQATLCCVIFGLRSLALASPGAEPTVFHHTLEQGAWMIRSLQHWM